MINVQVGQRPDVPTSATPAAALEARVAALEQRVAQMAKENEELKSLVVQLSSQYIALLKKNEKS